ncbi:MAG: hypothetical protein DRH04_06265 [Deltaproteobacteria bacterium]|nr:MAG: hypothetical protein DRH04_06265 [Deltaproteobacteria bacterium]
MKKTILAVFFLLFFIAAAAAAESAYMITFQTTDCNGDTGIATVEIDRIYKIRSISCEPPYQDARLKQVLVISKTLHGSYDVFTIDEKEAANIQNQIQAYMDARRKLLENGNPIILHDN